MGDYVGPLVDNCSTGCTFIILYHILYYTQNKKKKTLSEGRCFLLFY